MKTIIKTAVFLLITFVIAYFSANIVLRKLTKKAITQLQPRLEQKGIIIDNFDYSSVRMQSFNSCAVSNVNLLFHLNRKMFGKESFKATFHTESINIRFANFRNPSFYFTFHDFSLFIEEDNEAAGKTFGKLENGFLKSRIPLYLKTPEESAREILAEIKTLFRENKTFMDLEVKVDVMLGIDDKEIKVGLFTERRDSLTYLKFNTKDILSAAAEFELDLAEKEAEIIAAYPSKVPAMIKISRDAKKYSVLEKSVDGTFPEDAFRHIYWSYTLTREFGPDLAKRITDAHETAPGNTKEERAMDYHNNEVARKYAAEVLSNEDIKFRVLKAPEIIRFPDEAK